MINQDLRTEFAKAKAGGYAVPAFNFNDIWDLSGIIAAAEELRSPVILQTIARVLDCVGRASATAMALTAAREASVPVFLHLDHCNSVEYCKECVDLGFPMVMLDTSSLPLEENIAAVTEVCDYAHRRDALVEAELGRVMGNNEEGVYEGEDYLIQVDEAVRLVKESGVDILAVGIGTAHGFYKGTPKLHFDRLAEVNAALDIPLVLHGGTGIPEADIHRALTMGICKMNIGAALRYAYITGLQAELKDAEPTAHPLDVHASAREHIKKAAMEGILSQKANGRV